MNHLDVVRTLKNLPHNVRIVVARLPLPSVATSEEELAAAGFDLSPSSPSRMRAKSEDSLLMTPASSELAPWPQRSRSLEPLAGLALWSSEPVTVVLEKSQKGLGFSILDYHVSHFFLQKPVLWSWS